ncbi:MAG: hypothetical protein Q8L57_00170, partial [bacterium]|nr:hypothetical protein [bacterium]
MELERPILAILLIIGAGLIFFFLKKKMSVGFASIRNIPQSRPAKLAAALHGSLLPISVVLGLTLLAGGFHLSFKEITRYGYSS